MQTTLWLDPFCSEVMSAIASGLVVAGIVIYLPALIVDCGV
jgi:hypothetical protein